MSSELTQEARAAAAPATTAVWDVAVVGAGYVGVPLARVFGEAGKRVVLVDVDPTRVALLNRGESYVEDVPSPALAALVSAGLRATTDYDVIRDADAVLIALPTPLSKQREPDLSIVRGAVEQIARRLRPGHLIVLESTTYPGTTREQVLPLLEARGLRVGQDFNLAFSPERLRRDVLDVGLAPVDGVNPRRVDVDEHDALPRLHERLRERDADVAGTDDRHVPQARPARSRGGVFGRGPLDHGLRRLATASATRSAALPSP